MPVSRQPPRTASKSLSPSRLPGMPGLRITARIEFHGVLRDREEQGKPVRWETSHYLTAL